MDSLVISVLLFFLQLGIAALLGIQLGKKRRLIKREQEQVAQLKRNILLARGGAIYARRGFMRMPGLPQGKLSNQEGDWTKLTRERVRYIQEEYFTRRKRKGQSD